MTSSKHVFISFKSEERVVANRLREALKSSGYGVWWAEDLQCGQEWHGEIDKAIEDAGAIIVLWSNKSYGSPWVKHEASQAMAKRNYAPVRIELINIESPFSRIQATDLINWNGEKSHPGYQNLVLRLQELLPPPVSLWRRSVTFLWKQRAAIILFAIALAALMLLLRQSTILDKQIAKQEATFQNVQRQNQTLKAQGLALDSQLRKQDELIQNGHSQSSALDFQLRAQRLVSTQVQEQNGVLKDQIQKQEVLASQSLDMMSRQAALANAMDSSSQLVQSNLKIQQQSFTVLNKTAEDLKALNVPLVNGLLYIFKMRVYVDGMKNIWHDKNNQSYVLLSQGDTISGFVKKKIYKFPKQDYTKYDPYETFFTNISMGIGVSTTLNYHLGGKEGTIEYFENGANGYRLWSAPKIIYYNPAEEYFESEFTISSGAVKNNPDKISSLYSLFDSAQLILAFRLVGDGKYSLPVNSSSTETVRVKKIVLSEFSQIRYGNNFQFSMRPKNTSLIQPGEAATIKFASENIKDGQNWRYCIVSVPLEAN